MSAILFMGDTVKLRTGAGCGSGRPTWPPPRRSTSALRLPLDQPDDTRPSASTRRAAQRGGDHRRPRMTYPGCSKGQIVRVLFAYSFGDPAAKGVRSKLQLDLSDHGTRVKVATPSPDLVVPSGDFSGILMGSPILPA